jgi:YHS domain-containing protein
MKKFLLTLLLGALLTVNVLGQANLSFEYKDSIYYYSELPQIAFEDLPEDYITLEVDASAKEVVIVINGKIYYVVYE